MHTYTHTYIYRVIFAYIERDMCIYIYIHVYIYIHRYMYMEILSIHQARQNHFLRDQKTVSNGRFQHGKPEAESGECG